MPNTDIKTNQSGYIIKSDETAENWIKIHGQISNFKAVWKFALGQNGEIFTIISQQLSDNEIAFSVYKSINNGNTWILEGTNSKFIL